MPPVLDPANSKVDGLAFLGLSLARKSDRVGHPDSVTHQTAFDLNLVQDRHYKYIFSTNDDGWLVGGGEPGPPQSYKLAAKDSAHVEIIRLGTFRKEWGGVSKEKVISTLQAGKILIPQIEVVPTAVVANPDQPPELEIRFDMEPKVPVDLGKPMPETATTDDDDNNEPSSSSSPTHSRDPPDAKDGRKSKINNDNKSKLPPLPVNWQLRFLHNQLFRRFEFPSRFCPGAFHSTILRKAEFRSDQYRAAYFVHCQKAVDKWRKAGPQPLVPDVNNDTPGIVRAHCADPRTGKVVQDQRYQSGIYLFTDRNTITHHFVPNFLPPYDTPEKRQIILDVLGEEWDEKTLSWKPVLLPERSGGAAGHPDQADNNIASPAQVVTKESKDHNNKKPAILKETPTESTEDDGLEDLPDDEQRGLSPSKAKEASEGSNSNTIDNVLDIALHACALD